MQTTLCWGRALPGGNRKQHNNTRTTTRESRGTPTRTAVTPQALLPRQIRQAYMDGQAQLLAIHNQNNEQQRTETFGDAMGTKNSDSVRLVGQNIGCLGVRSFNNQKQDAGKDWLISNNVDICC